MLKRTRTVNWFISTTLGFSIGSFGLLAIQKSDFFFGIQAVVAVIAAVLHVLCEDDIKPTEKS